MKITEIGKYYPPYKGGIESHIYSISNNLKKWVNKIKVLVFNTSMFSVEEKENNLTVKRCSNFFEFASTPFSFIMFYEILKDKSDIIHIHTPNPSVNFYYNIALKFKKKDHLLFISHHSDIVSQKLAYMFYKPMLKKLYKKADKIIVATKAHVTYSDILPEFLDKIEIIPYGIAPEQFKISSKIKLRVLKTKEFLENKKIILFTGRLVYYKGVSFLIEAFNKLKRNDTTLVILGNGPYFSTLKAQAMQNENIVFIPEADDEQLQVFLHACSIFVLPSIEKSEAFGIVQLEAMACGKPVISTKLNSGVRSVNIDKVTGLQVEPKNSDDLMQALDKLLSDDELREEYGKNAIYSIKENYSSENCAKKIYNLYKSELDNKIRG
ncbi:MAG: glycosyltransferase [Candidatus Muirbacterium halophilum]|nr:glycosyltransferase [Candidatus Muirbacterium halophilum]